MEAMHDSRQLRYRNPFGALQAGQDVRLMIALDNELQEADVLLRLWVRGEEQLIPMQKSASGGRAWASAVAQAPSEPGLMWYYFILRLPGGPAGRTLYYGGQSGAGALYDHEPPGYQITVYDPAFDTPRWFREGLMYQIFPDRFRRGGDATAGIAYHEGLGRKVRVHTDWYEQPYFTPAEGEAQYQPNDFYCGDLDGIREKIPYLKSLGVSCLYLNPVFESASNHRYDTADYRRIDPILGGDEAFRRLSEAAREAGIRLMLDGVFSHTGADSVYFNKYGRYATPGAFQGEQSPYRSWYRFEKDHFSYHSWWGFPELPEVEENDPGYLDFIMGEGKDSLLRHWANYGAGNWRLDVADELPDSFIATMRARLKEIDPEAVLLGEVWEDASNKEAYGQRRAYVYGRELDSVMNYPFRAAVLGFLLGRYDAYALNYALGLQREHYPKPFYYACMNLLSSHDSVRALTELSGAPNRDSVSREQQAAYRPGEEALRLAKARLLVAAAIQVAAPGVPCVYYGDEAGAEGMADPFNRGTYPWGREDEALLAAFRALGQARAQNAALKSGFCRMGAPHQDVFAMLRYTAGGRDAFHDIIPGDAAALLFANRANEPRSVFFHPSDLVEGPDAGREVSLGGSWREAQTGRAMRLDDGVARFDLPPLAAELWLRV